MSRHLVVWLKNEEIESFKSIMDFYLDFVDGDPTDADLLAKKLLGKAKTKRKKKEVKRGKRH